MIVTGLQDVEYYKDGMVLLGEFGSSEVSEFLGEYEPCELCVMDPPYVKVLKAKWDDVEVNKFAIFMIEQLKWLSAYMDENSAAYMFGGIGTYQSRFLFHLLSELETLTPWHIADAITWGKKRAYGKRYAYQFAREELVYLTSGEPKDVRCFNIPYLDKLRGYAGFNKKYPAKSKYLRRTNVWTDIPEMFRGKLHDAQKPVQLIKVPILTSSRPGETVFDPFAGSGTTALAARETGRRFILVESDTKSFDICNRRLRGEI